MRILLIAVVVYLSIKVLSLLYRYARSQSVNARIRVHRTDSTLDASEMVRDPVCGVYVSARDALPVTVNGVTVFFCSKKCLRLFIEGRG